MFLEGTASFRLLVATGMMRYVQLLQKLMLRVRNCTGRLDGERCGTEEFVAMKCCYAEVGKSRPTRHANFGVKCFLCQDIRTSRFCEPSFKASIKIYPELTMQRSNFNC